MAGRIKKIIDTIVEQRSKGNPVLVNLTKAKITMKGIAPEKYNEFSEDDPVILQKLTTLANELNIKI